jgi:hypothetical protein
VRRIRPKAEYPESRISRGILGCSGAVAGRVRDRECRRPHKRRCLRRRGKEKDRCLGRALRGRGLQVRGMCRQSGGGCLRGQRMIRKQTRSPGSGPGSGTFRTCRSVTGSPYRIPRHPHRTRASPCPRTCRAGTSRPRPGSPDNRQRDPLRRLHRARHPSRRTSRGPVPTWALARALAQVRILESRRFQGPRRSQALRRPHDPRRPQAPRQPPAAPVSPRPRGPCRPAVPASLAVPPRPARGPFRVDRSRCHHSRRRAVRADRSHRTVPRSRRELAARGSRPLLALAPWKLRASVPGPGLRPSSQGPAQTRASRSRLCRNPRQCNRPS